MHYEKISLSKIDGELVKKFQRWQPTNSEPSIFESASFQALAEKEQLSRLVFLVVQHEKHHAFVIIIDPAYFRPAIENPMIKNDMLVLCRRYHVCKSENGLPFLRV